MMVIQPDAGVFAQLMSRWHSGNYTFVDSGEWGFRSGDDDQVSSALLASGRVRRLYIGAYTLPPRARLPLPYPCRLVLDSKWFYVSTFAGPPDVPPTVTGPGLTLHSFGRCVNDKGGQFRCHPDEVALLHKFPEWETSRVRALRRAARAGKCLANPALLGWKGA